jgi:SPP1 gp7 family putative phage head morphogenesis protein
MIGRGTKRMTSIEQKPEIKKIQIQNFFASSTGTEIYTGEISEEYLYTLKNTTRATVFDKMRRGDSRVKMVLSAVKNPIRSASYQWDCENQEHADFLNFIFFSPENMETWRLKINEFLSCVDFGHTVFEKVHKLVLGHKAWGDFYTVDLGWISPKTITEWNTDKQTGKLLNIRQRAMGDLTRNVLVPSEFLSVVTVDQEGSNFEGISMLRPCFGAWKRKDVYLKLMAIGVEKSAIKPPVVEVPAAAQGTVQYTNLINALELYSSHQCNYLTKPEGWKIDFLDSNFDPDKIKSAIQFENQEMAFAFLANFLELGATGSGSYALSNDLSDFFLGGLTYLADGICEALNKIGRELIILKFGEQEIYPALKASGIKDKAGQEFGNLLKSLSDGRYIIPDDKLEANIRKRIGLPEADPTTSRKQPDSNPFASNPNPTNTPRIDESGNSDDESDGPEIDQNINNETTQKLSNCTCGVKLAKSRSGKQIEMASVTISDTLRDNLERIRNNSLEAIRKLYNNSSENEKVLIPSKLLILNTSGINAFKRQLEDKLTSVSNDAIDQVKTELKTTTDVRASTILGIRFVSKKLPKKLSNRIKQQANLLAESTVNDLDKIVAFAFGDALATNAALEIIVNDIKNASDKFLEGGSVATAAANVASRIVNESRNEMFFDPEIMEEIETLEFVNDDPISPICQDLAGIVFDANDPEAQRYFPPLHHNCKSTLKANLIRKTGTGPAKTEGGLRPSDPKLEKYITLG